MTFHRVKETKEFAADRGRNTHTEMHTQCTNTLQALDQNEGRLSKRTTT